MSTDTSNGLPLVYYLGCPVKMIKAFMYNINFPTIEVPITFPTNST